MQCGSSLSDQALADELKDKGKARHSQSHGNCVIMQTPGCRSKLWLTIEGRIS